MGHPPFLITTHCIINLPIHVYNVQWARGGCYERMPSYNTKEFKVRITSKMQKVIETVINNTDIDTKKKLVSVAVRNNVYSIQEKLAGQKSITDFIASLDSDVEWVHVNTKDISINCKLDVNQSLDTFVKSEVSDKYHKVLNSCSRSSDFSKSDIIRACMVRELYNRKDSLTKAESMRVEDRWKNIKTKMRKAKHMHIDKLFYLFDEDYIMYKASDELEKKNIFYIVNHYEEFKEKEGFEVLREHDRGEEIINTLESVKQKYNGMGNNQSTVNTNPVDP